MNALARMLAAIWLGAMVCAAFFAAPSVFGVLDNDNLAGSIMGPVFRRTDFLGLAACLVAFYVCRRRRGAALLAVVGGILTAVSAFWLSPRILAGEAERYHHVATALWTVLMAIACALALVAGKPKRVAG